MKNNIKKTLEKLKLARTKNNLDFTPVFLIGCGRSGTTILGNTLGKLKDITYLNERRDLWHKAYPEFDIWSGKVKSPKLIVTKEDHTLKKTNKLKSLFIKEQKFNKGKILLEKLPINNFRLEFINVAFPNAKFIYLHRNGLEVAKSIEKLSEKGKWYGKNNIKLELLKSFIESKVEIPKKEFTYYEMGLLEWRFSLDYSESFFSNLDKCKFFSLSYNSFLDNPSFQINQLLNFLKIDCNSEQIENLTRDIKRRSEKLTNLTASDIKIGGNNLKLSVENKLEQTTPNPQV